MATNVHITRINDTASNIRANMDEYQSGVETSNDRYVFADATHITVCASGWKYAKSDGAVTYLDEWFKDIVLSGSLYLNTSIIGNGDDNTTIEHSTDNWLINAGGVLMLDMNAAAAQKYFCINGNGSDIDTCVGDAPYDLLVSGSSGRTGLKCNDIDARLNIGNTAYSNNFIHCRLTDANGDDLTVHNMTDYFQVGVLGAFTKLSGGSDYNGGLRIIGLSSFDNALALDGYCNNMTGDGPVIAITGAKHDGANSITEIDGDDILLSLFNESTEVLTINGAGDMTVVGDLIVNGAINNVAPIGSCYVYEGVAATVITKTDQYHGITVFGADEEEGVTFLVGLTGSITNTANNGGILRCTDVDHGLLTGQYITLNNMTTNVHSIQTRVTKIDNNTFDCDDIAYAAAGDTGSWQRGASLTIGAGNGGHWLLAYAVSCYPAANNKNFKFEPMINTTHFDQCATENKLLSTTDYQVLSNAYPIELLAGDTVQLMLKNTTDATDLTIIHGNLILTRLGGA
jgi:hypothetical protein